MDPKAVKHVDDDPSHIGARPDRHVFPVERRRHQPLPDLQSDKQWRQPKCGVDNVGRPHQRRRVNAWIQRGAGDVAAHGNQVVPGGQKRGADRIPHKPQQARCRLARDGAVEAPEVQFPVDPVPQPVSGTPGRPPACQIAGRLVDDHSATLKKWLPHDAVNAKCKSCIPGGFRIVMQRCAAVPSSRGSDTIHQAPALADGHPARQRCCRLARHSASDGTAETHPR